MYITVTVLSTCVENTVNRQLEQLDLQLALGLVQSYTPL